MARRSAILVVGALLGGMVGVPVGMYLAHPVPDAPAPAAVRGALRSHYSPAIYSDFAFTDQLRPIVETLERGCRVAGEHCREARAARQRLTELQGRR